MARTGSLALRDFVEPRIEPEIVFGLARAPDAGMDDLAMLNCLAWVAHGFEIVQSIFPNWKFTPADTAAANAMHGALLIGRRHAIAPRKADWLRELPAFEIDLYCNGASADRGRAANVLDGPVSALRHLVQSLAQDPVSPPLAAGDIVTTGTLTRALPINAGETWTTSCAEFRWKGSLCASPRRSGFARGLEHRRVERLARAFPRPDHKLEGGEMPLAGVERGAEQRLALLAGGLDAARQYQRVAEHDDAFLHPQIEMADPHLLVDQRDQRRHLARAAAREP